MSNGTRFTICTSSRRSWCEIELLEKVRFEPGKAIIKPESYRLLDDVATVILTTPDIGRIEIEGHTDSQGSEAYNLRLSQQRADAVRDYLVRQSVPTEQLLSKGFGETLPIDTNKTPNGREANRRVKFTRIDTNEGRN